MTTADPHDRELEDMIRNLATRHAAAMLLLLLMAAALLAVPAHADTVTLGGTMSFAGDGTGTVNVVLAGNLNIRDGIGVTIESDAPAAGLALVERGAGGDSPHGAAWMQVDAAEVCARTPDCDGQFIDGPRVFDTPETMGELPAGDYQLIVFATPAAPVTVTVDLNDGGATADFLGLPAAGNVQAARIAESDPAGLDHTWWAGAERTVEAGAVEFLVAAVAGDFSGPHEFNACVYTAGTVSDTLGSAGLGFAPPCAHGTSAGARVVAVKTDYTATLTASAYNAAGGTYGIGAYVNGAQSVTGSVVSGLWVDPLD